MALIREAYHALEDIVGPENISEESAILDGYCFVRGNELHFDDRYAARPLAVVMPGSTAEVQAIVKICNKFRIKYKAHSSGWDFAAISSREPFLPLDLRRMDKIIEIDTNNKYAVVEPYVSVQKLFITTMKEGLRPHTVGCGPSAGVLASATAHFGCGPTSISSDYAGRVPLGVEWVLPDGEILKLGSLGTGAGWFSGDGSGPSLRGIMRGISGANGGLGVITKAAVRLAPYYGPPRIMGEGKPNIYGCNIPSCFANYFVIFPSRDKLTDFFLLLVEEAIGHSAQRNSASVVAMVTTESNDDFWNAVKNSPPEAREMLRFSATVLLDAGSPREMEYRKKCFEAIIEKVEGHIIPLDSRTESAVFFNSLTCQGTQRIFRISGSFLSAVAVQESWDACAEAGKRTTEDLYDKYEKSGLIGESGESPWASAFVDSCGHIECVIVYDQLDENSVNAVKEILAQADEKLPEWRLAMGSFEGALTFEERAQKAAAKYCMDFLTYEKKIKKAFDPNLVSESSAYVSVKE
jgi:glycolate oxidase